MAGILGAIALIAVLAAVGYVLLPGPMMTPMFGIPILPAALLFGVGLALLLKYFKVSYAKALPFTKQTAGIVGVLLIGVTVWQAGLLSMALPAATFIPGVPAAITGVSVTECRQSIMASNPTILGKAATLTINGYDFAANAPYSAKVGAGTYVFKDGQFLGQVNTAGYTITNLKVGDVVDIYGLSNATYYVDNVMRLCIDGEQTTQEVRAYTATAVTQTKVVCYDSDGNTLSAGSNASFGDYNLTIGANEKVVVDCKLKVNVANTAFWLRGIATNGINTTDTVKVTSAGWSEGIMPTFLSSAAIATVESGQTATVQGYERVYKLASPIKLGQWQETTVRFEVKGDTTADPVFVGVPLATNLMPNAVIQFLDEGTGREGATGAAFNDIATHDDAGTNLGIAEVVASPLGKLTGTVINCI